MMKLALKPRYSKTDQSISTDSNHNEAIAPYTLNMQFDVALPNKV